jgi:hypothetical protein
MFSNAVTFPWVSHTADKKAVKPSKPRRTTVFITDAVQPWGDETLLLTLLRRDAQRLGGSYQSCE